MYAKCAPQVVGEIVDGNRKAELLQEIARKEGLNLKQARAAGWGWVMTCACSRGWMIACAY